MRNDSELQHAAWQGYTDAGYPITVEPYLFSSPCWIAYRAGKEMAMSGRTRPVKVTMSRGYSVRMETASGIEFVALFDKDLTGCKIERK